MRSGSEPKPAWRSVPTAVRWRVGDLLGAPVARGIRTWGGYGPTPTYRLLLANGRRAFFKGTNADSNDFARHALDVEERAYRELAGLISRWAPALYGAFRLADWHVLLLEDAGPATTPPWRPEVTRRIAHAYADFHAATLGRDLPSWLPGPTESLPRFTWKRVAAESDNLRHVAAMAGEQRRDADRWLRAALPRLSQLADSAATIPGPYAVLHGDTRSDNLRFAGDRLYLFDWPSVEAGRPEFDVVAFAQSITVEGGPEPERFLAWYGERLQLRPDVVDTAVAWLAAFFADLAWRPDIPGLPRLRRFQRQQLSIVLPWAAQRLYLPRPAWVTTLN